MSMSSSYIYQTFLPWMNCKRPDNVIKYLSKASDSEQAERIYQQAAAQQLDTAKYPAAGNGASNLQRCRAAGYLTLAAVAKCACRQARLARCSQE